MSAIFSSAPPAYTETSSMEHATMAQRADRDFVLRHVAHNGRELQYASEKLKDDREVVMTAVTNDGMHALRHASNRLFKDIELQQLAFFSKESDKEYVMRDVARYGSHLQYASEALKDDKEIVITAVTNAGWNALRHASERLKVDEELQKLAMSVTTDQYDIPLLYASEALRNDKEFVMRRVAQDGHELQYASDEFKDDRKVVITAVAANAGKCALRHASNRLRDDKELREKAASAKYDKLMMHASDALKADMEIIRIAVANGTYHAYAQQHPCDSSKWRQERACCDDAKYIE